MDNKKPKNYTTEEHGTTKQLTQAEKEQRQKALKIQQEKDKEPVRGIFHYYEVPGGAFSFCYKAYKGDQVERHDFIDGQIYTIPLGVAKHLNKSGTYPIYEYVPDGSGVIAGYGNGVGMRIKTNVRRFGFQSLEFVDIDDLTPEGTPLSLVERAPQL